MTIFTYAVEERKMGAIRWRFGKASYIDVTECYQDILALCADKVLIAIEHTAEDILSVVRGYQEEVSGEDDTEYFYLTDDEIDAWIQKYYCDLEDAIEGVSKEISEEEYEALHLLGIQKYHGGLISKIYVKEDGKVKHYEFYRPKVGKRELLIISLGDNQIDAATYHAYEKDYDIVSVGCYREMQTRASSLRDLFEDRMPKEELPPILCRVKTELDKVTLPYMYAYFGE